MPNPNGHFHSRQKKITMALVSYGLCINKMVSLVCPRCSGPLKIISLIGDGPVIEKILRHLKLWDRQERPPPPAPDRSIRYDPDIPGFEEVSRWSDATE